MLGKAVAKFLIEKGINKNRIKTKAYGESSPIYNCEECSDEEHEQNVIAVCRAHAQRGGLVIVATHREDLLRHAAHARRA